MTQTYPGRQIEVGDRFGRWVVLGLPDLMEDRYANGKPHHPRWHCRCDCGTERTVTGANLLGGYSRYCGCARAETAAQRLRIHGQTATRLHGVWSNMLQRCDNPANRSYGWYGGREIGVCGEWRDFRVFREWALKAGYRQGEGLTLERINNDRGYSPENCCWIPRIMQARNRRSNRLLTAWDETKLLVEWTEDYRSRGQVSLSLLRWRLSQGWLPEQAISTPPQQHRRTA